MVHQSRIATDRFYTEPAIPYESTEEDEDNYIPKGARAGGIISSGILTSRETSGQHTGRNNNFNSAGLYITGRNETESSSYRHGYSRSDANAPFTTSNADRKKAVFNISNFPGRGNPLPSRSTNIS